MLYDIQGQTMNDKYFLRYIQSMKSVEDYVLADKITQIYLNKKGDKKQLAYYSYQKKQMDSFTATKSLYQVKNLEINSPQSDFGTAFYGQKKVYASSKENTKPNKSRYSWSNQLFLSLYIAEQSQVDGSLFNEEVFLPNAINKYHETTATFSPDLKTIYCMTNIVKNNNRLVIDRSRINNFQIIKGTIENGKLRKTEKMFFNSIEYSVDHPSLSEDGQWLFFASDMPGGYGETDLYVVQITKEGTMGSRRNLGPKINTIGNEMFPYIRNGILYFSSEGHYGLDDLDVYQSKFSEGLYFSTPKNLNEPMNSSKDDFSYIVSAEDSFGYVSSSRGDGKGDDDIYYFSKSKPVCDQWVCG